MVSLRVFVIVSLFCASAAQEWSCLTNSDCENDNFLCWNRECELACSSNEDCGPDDAYVCGTQNVCEKSCVSDSDCIDGFSESFMCVGGTCAIPCGAWFDCPMQGQVCPPQEDQHCVTGCNDDMDCELQFGDSHVCVWADCMPVDVLTPCDTTADCTNNGLQCYAGFCSPWCTDGMLDCPMPGTDCINSFCQVTCTTTSDCMLGEVCRDGGCDRGGGECSEDADCDGGQFCYPDNTCGAGCSVASDCGFGGACDEGLCFQNCVSDEFCPDFELCYSGICRAECNPASSGCASGEMCHELATDIGVCMESCDVGIDCHDSEICHDGSCETGCRRDGDCFDEKVCVAGACRAEYDTCCLSSDCNVDGYGCNRGICEPMCENVFDCVIDSTTCFDDFCRPSCGFGGGDCFSGEACAQDTACMPACQENDDCGDCEVCHYGHCEPKCNSTDDCDDMSLCVDNACETHYCSEDCEVWFNGCGTCDCTTSDGGYHGTTSNCTMERNECDEPEEAACVDNFDNACYTWQTQWSCPGRSVARTVATVCLSALLEKIKCTAAQCCTSTLPQIQQAQLAKLRSIRNLNRLSQLRAVQQASQYQVMAYLQYLRAMMMQQYYVQNVLFSMQGYNHGPPPPHVIHVGSHYRY